MNALEELLSRLDDGLARAATRDEHIRWAGAKSLAEKLCEDGVLGRQVVDSPGTIITKTS